MEELSQRCPKPLLPVGNKPLIVHHLEFLKSFGIEEVLIIIGFAGNQIRNALGDGGQYGMSITYVEQYAPLGSAHALTQIAALVDKPFMLLLGDYYFHAPGVQKMFEAFHAGACVVIASKSETDPQALREACVLEVDSDNRVTGITEKPFRPRGTLKGCGIYICDLDFLDIVRRTPRTALRNEYELTMALDLCVRSGLPVIAPQVIEWDMNFTRPEDVLCCNLLWLRHNRIARAVGSATRLADGTVLEMAVVGDGAVCTHPVELRQTVVFPNVHIPARQRIEKALVLDELIIQCSGGLPESI